MGDEQPQGEKWGRQGPPASRCLRRLLSEPQFPHPDLRGGAMLSDAKSRAGPPRLSLQVAPGSRRSGDQPWAYRARGTTLTDTLPASHH